MKEHIVIVMSLLEIDTPGVILHSAKHDWLNWSHDKFRTLDLLSWLWCL